MELITTGDIVNAAKLNNFGGENTARLLMSVLKLDKINSIYAQHAHKPVIDFLNDVTTDVGLRCEVSDDDLAKIPRKGPFILVGNHPYGGVEGLLLLKHILPIRPDFKIMANFLFQRIEPVSNYIFAVNPFETHKKALSSYSGLKKSLAHIAEGHPLAIFPAGEVSTFQPGINGVADRKWDKGILKILKNAGVPIVPVYFHGTNSRMFHWLGMVHPLLRTAKIPSELLNKRDQVIKIRIGTPISTADQELFSDYARFGRYLRAKTYALGTSINVNDFFKQRKKLPAKAEKVMQPVDREILCAEIEKITPTHLLFTHQQFSVFCSPTTAIPNITMELGRLREITFREVGEGTNLSKDIDEYDLYYHQLFIWDNENKAIAGGYRIGKGNEILSQYGPKGFYIRSLFKMDKRISWLLKESIELGRSFITSEYQRKPMSLFLLWKGILFFLLKNHEYRYLIGPVSISNSYTHFSKHMMVDFLKRNYFNHEIAKFIKPRKPFVPAPGKVDTEILTEEVHNLNQLESMIRDIDIYNTRIPVLLKKYTMLGGKIVCFNIDPDFNDCLDGLLVLDLFDVPKDIINSLSKELKDESVLNRFKIIEPELNRNKWK